MVLIRLPERAESALSTLAIRERRDMRSQAEWLIECALIQRGLLAREGGPLDEALAVLQPLHDDGRWGRRQNL